MMTDAPLGRTARGDALLIGSSGPACASTCSLIRDGAAPDPAVLHASRVRVLELADEIVPGHGAPFRPTDATPR